MTFEAFYFETAKAIGSKIKYGKTKAVSNRKYVDPSTVNFKELENSIFAVALENQLILEVLDNLPSDKKKELNKKVETALRNSNIPFSVVFSGGSSYHFHIFIEPTLFKKLKSKFEVNKNRIWFNKKWIVFKELLVKFLGMKVGIKNITELLDLYFLQLSHMFPFPNKKRDDKPKPTLLVYEDLNYWKFDEKEFYNFLESIKETEDDKEYIDLHSLFLTNKDSTKINLVKKYLETQAKNGAKKGSRDISAFKFYLKCRSVGVSKEDSKKLLRLFLLNSEPKGSIDSEKERIYEKVDKYWENYFKEKIETKSKKYKTPQVVEDRVEMEDEIISEFITEYLKEILSFFPRFERIISIGSEMLYLVLEINNRNIYIPFQNREGDFDSLKGFVRLNNSLLENTLDMKWSDYNNYLREIYKKDQRVKDILFVTLGKKIGIKVIGMIDDLIQDVLDIYFDSDKKAEDFINEMKELDFTIILQTYASQKKLNLNKVLSSLGVYFLKKDDKLLPNNSLLNKLEKAYSIRMREVKKQEEMLDEKERDNEIEETSEISTQEEETQDNNQEDDDLYDNPWDRGGIGGI